MNMLTPMDFQPRRYSDEIADQHMEALIEAGFVAGDMAQDEPEETEEPGLTWIHAALFTGVMLGIGLAVTAIIGG